MASWPYTLKNAWDIDNVYEADGETDIELSNTGQGDLRWAVTPNDTPPTIEVSQGHPIKPFEGKSMTLLAGERLWLATTDHGSSTVED